MLADEDLIQIRRIHPGEAVGPIQARIGHRSRLMTRVQEIRVTDLEEERVPQVMHPKARIAGRKPGDLLGGA